MFLTLADAVEELAVPVDGRAIAAAIALRDRVDAKIAEAVGHFDADGAEPARSLHLSQTMGGRYELSGSLDNNTGDVVATALRLATTDDVEAEPARTPAERRADALGDVCRYFLDHQTTRSGGRHRPHLNVVVDLDALERGRIEASSR